MIKDLMELGINTSTNVKEITVNASYVLADKFLPYCVGYFPFSYVQNSNLFKLTGNTSVITGGLGTGWQFDFVGEYQKRGHPTKGVPFAWANRDRRNENLGVGSFYNPDIITTKYILSPFCSSVENNACHLFTRWNIEKGISTVTKFEEFVLEIKFKVRIFITTQNSDNPQVTDKIEYFEYVISSDDTAEHKINPYTLSFDISQNLYGREITITDQTWKRRENAGIHVFTGTDGHQHRYFWIVEDLCVRTFNYVPVCETGGYRFNQFNEYNTLLSHDKTHTIRSNVVAGLSFSGNEPFENEHRYTPPTGIKNITGLIYDGRYYYIYSSGLYTYNTALYYFINGGYDYNDLIYWRCALPIWHYNGTWYTGEYDDNYVLTGNIIPFEDARDWQKNLNPDTNDFNWEDIPSGSFKEDESGDKVPNQFNKVVGVASNFVTQYLLTSGQIAKFGEILWTSWADQNFNTEILTNFYGVLNEETGSWNISAVLDFIVSCRLFPMSLPTLVSNSPTTSVSIGSGAFGINCGTIREPSFFIANESVAVRHCGSVLIPNTYFDFRDYDNTNVTVYLPFCGSVQLSPADVVGKYLGCTYAIDLFDGSCKAFLYVMAEESDGYNDAFYNVAIKTGQCGFLIPLSATNAGQVASRKQVDGYTDGMYTLNSLTSMFNSVASFAEGDVLGGIRGIGQMAQTGIMDNRYNAIVRGRSGIDAPSTSGGSSFADFMQPAKPYVQVRRAIYQEPLEYESTVGYISDSAKYNKVSDFKGFCQFKNVDLSGLNCNEDERNEIKAILESGVYV